MNTAKLIGLGVVIAPLLLLSQPAEAQVPGLRGSYIGTSVNGDLFQDASQSFVDGGSLNQQILEEALRQQGLLLNSGKRESGAAALGQQYQGRLDLQNSALSLRGTVYLEEGASALLPTVSYDFAVGDRTNIYAGAGYAFVESQGGITPIGDRDGLVVTAGAEAEALPGLVIYGDAKLGINTDSVRGNSPVRLQVGVGRRF